VVPEAPKLGDAPPLAGLVAAPLPPCDAGGLNMGEVDCVVGVRVVDVKDVVCGIVGIGIDKLEAATTDAVGIPYSWIACF